MISRRTHVDRMTHLTLPPAGCHHHQPRRHRHQPGRDLRRPGPESHRMTAEPCFPLSQQTFTQTTQGNILAPLRAVRAFLDQNTDLLAAVMKTAARKLLDDAIPMLSTHTSDQTRSNLA